ncbi:histidine phosphatase superfamily [Lipomyces tetrasporus]|uniref:Histidine phosphatase superfamily n=1 Tax=Lipomyces tetrasporus TaxID=54092 RepID=A0AAD7QZ31_9ASCO|nr:histidine phosphatase superfamily [Lipomyces tetrasporus]KAJ8102452.1 histidine phosphatase superfamily [Lipomyces tetrasporus]
MPVERIYVTRHGFRSNWDTTVPPKPAPTGIDGDPPLSAHGEEQAHELCIYLSTILPSVVRIYTSPFYRCLQTICELADLLKVDILPEYGFGEWYGRTRKTHPRAASQETLKSYFTRVSLDYEPIAVPSTEGETIQELHDRAEAVLAAMIKDCNENHPEVKTVVICAHAATIIALGRALVGDMSYDVRTGTCSISVYDADPSDNSIGKWTCLINGSASHLVSGEERHWSFETGEYDFLDVQAYHTDSQDVRANHARVSDINSVSVSDTVVDGKI